MLKISDTNYPSYDSLHYVRRMLLTIESEPINDHLSETEEDLFAYCDFLGYCGFGQYSDDICRHYIEINDKKP